MKIGIWVTLTALLVGMAKLRVPNSLASVPDDVSTNGNAVLGPTVVAFGSMIPSNSWALSDVSFRFDRTAKFYSYF